MAKKATLKRRKLFVDERALRRAKKLLGVSTDAEVVLEAVERVADVEGLWKFMKKSRQILEPGSIEAP